MIRIPELKTMVARATDKTRRSVVTLKPGIVPANAFTNNTIIVFEPGNYLTTGISLPESCALIAREPGTVNIKLMPPNVMVPGQLNSSYMPTILSRSAHMMEFYAYGINFNCNWDELIDARAAAKGNFKLGAFALKTWQGVVESCSVINFGCDGGSYVGLGAEVFPLRLDTWAGPGVGENLPTPGVEILNCSVSKPHFVDGGYCTAIFTQTNQGLSGGDRFSIGKRTQLVASIHDNVVDVPGGIALGCANSEFVEFTDNQITNTKCMFNFDTLSVYNITITNNHGSNVNQGISLTGASNHVSIDNNNISLGEPFYNKMENLIESQWAVRLQNNTYTMVSGNIITSSMVNTANYIPKLVVGSYVGSNNFLAPVTNNPEPTPSTDNKVLQAAYDEAIALNTQLKSELAAALSTVEDLKKTNTEFVDSIISLNDKIVKLTSECDILAAKNVDLIGKNTALANSNDDLIETYDELDNKLTAARDAFKTLQSL